jgi:hypothetical protein
VADLDISKNRKLPRPLSADPIAATYEGGRVMKSWLLYLLGWESNQDLYVLYKHFTTELQFMATDSWFEKWIVLSFFSPATYFEQTLW